MKIAESGRIGEKANNEPQRDNQGHPSIQRKRSALGFKNFGLESLSALRISR